jgi:hypothetical protein
MATPKEISGRIDALFSEWSGGFTPLSAAVKEMRREMYIRIFGIGTGGGKNQAGDTLPTVPYSAAYAKIKAKNGRPPLELTGFLKRSFGTDETTVITEGFDTAIYLQADEAGKALGLEKGVGSGNPKYKTFKGYGTIFKPTKEEQDRMLKLHAELLVEQISNQISKP